MQTQLTPTMEALNEVIGQLRRPIGRGYKAVVRDEAGKIIGTRETFEPFNGRSLAAEGGRLVNQLDHAGLKGSEALLAAAITADYCEAAAPYLGIAAGADLWLEAKNLRDLLARAGVQRT